MKPKLLKIAGLNSFEKEQIVDFEKLTAKGLFGIFGSTGSGKSTIIDAITMSLYGQIPRFGGEKIKQCINVNCDTMHLSLHFNIGDDLYVVERSYKRSGQSMLSTATRLFTYDEGNVKILAEKTTGVNEEIVKLIGLNYKDFSRSVVLPQGKFSDFLLLANIERKEMLERIFGLEKYGEILYKNIKSELVKIKMELEVADANAGIDEEISREILEKGKADLVGETRSIEKMKIEKNEKSVTLKELENSLDNKNEFEKYRAKSLELDEKKEHIYDEKQKLEKAKKVAIIKPLISSLEEKERQISEINLNFSEKTKENMEISDKIISLKKNFEVFSKDKDEKYPKLLEKENNLKQVMEFLKELEALNIERETLLDEYKRQKFSLDDLTNEEKKLTLEKAEKTRYIEELSTEKQGINISTEYRNQVYDAFAIFNKLAEVKENHNNFVEKYNISEKFFKQEMFKQIECENIVKEILAQNSKLDKQLEEISQNRTVSPEDLLKLQSKLIEKENEFNLRKIDFEKQNKLEITINELKEKVDIKTNEDNFQKKEIFTLNSEIENIKEEIEDLKMKDISYHLSLKLKEGGACPVCGSIHHPDLARDVGNLKNGELSKTYENLIIKKEKNDEENRNLSAEIFSLKNEISNFWLQFEELVRKLDNFDVEKESKVIISMKDLFREAEKSLRTWEKKKQDAIDILNLEKEKLNKENINFASLLEKTSNIKILNKELEDKIEIEKKEMEKIEKRLSEYEKILGNRNFVDVYKDLEKKDKRRIEIEKLEDDIRKELSEFGIKEKSINADILKMEKKIEKIKTIGDGKRLRIDKIKNDIENLIGDVNPDEALISVGNEIKSILENFADSQKKYDEAQKMLQESEKNMSGLESNLKILFAMVKQEEEKLKSEIEKSGFIDKNDALLQYITTEEMHKIDEMIEKYQIDLNENNSNLNRVYEKLQNIDLDNLEENVGLNRQNLKDLDGRLEEKIENYALKKANISKMEKDLENSKKYLKKKIALKNKLGLLEDLTDLLEGRKFIEYVAKRHLKYIVVEASRKLKEMTSMRYALELDESDFVIRDDINGGIRRSPRTLSGGETFMVSLCLALALSSKMQLKSSTPLEFFFLDEGFGTLDPYLIDVVMCSLEQLQRENLSVGIITHVEELKNRVPAKLLVTSARDGLQGSEINIG